MDKLQAILSNIFHVVKVLWRFIRAQAKQSPYLTKSLILHFILLIFISGMIPRCSTKIDKPQIIEVNIIQAPPVVEKTEPKPEPVKQKKVEPKKEPPKPEPKKEEPKKVEPKREQTATKKKEEVVKKKSDIPSLKKEEIIKKPKKEEPKKEDKKEEKKQEAEEDKEGKKSLLKDLEKKELDEIFDKLEEEPKKEEEKPKEKPKVEQKEAPKKEAEFVPDAKFVNEIKNIVTGQIIQCWSIPIGAKSVDELAVELYIKLDRKGNVKTVKIIDQYRYNTDNTYRVLADSAVWAVEECSPLNGLPEDKHKFWEEIQFTFDASSIL